MKKAKKTTKTTDKVEVQATTTPAAATTRSVEAKPAPEQNAEPARRTEESKDDQRQLNGLVKTSAGGDTTSGERGHILFRHLGDNVSPDQMPNCQWQVEYHEGRGFPSGVAWIIDPPERTTKVRGGIRPTVKFILVDDRCRRKGIATALIEAGRERWPDLVLSPPISEAGAGLFKKLQTLIPEDIFTEEALQRFEQEGISRDELVSYCNDMIDHMVRLAIKLQEA